MAKSIPEVKIGNEVYQIKDRTAREHLVEVSTTQPTSEDNKLWIKNQEAEYEVPTIDELNDLKSAIDGIREHTKNLFDPSNVLNAYFTTGNIKSNDATRMVWIPCEQSTEYTISKTAGTRFIVGYTTELPAIGVTPSGVVTNYEGSSITITTGADAEFLVAWVFNGGSDSGTADEMLASVQIEKRSSATAYEVPYTAIDLFSRKSLSAYIGTNPNGIVNYNYSTKVITFPAGFIYRQGQGKSKTSTQQIDLTNILTNDACVFYVDSTNTIYAKAWNATNDDHDPYIGYVFTDYVRINGIKDEKIKVVDSDGNQYNGDKTSTALIGMADGLEVTYNYTTKTLTIPGGFTVYRGKGIARGSTTTLDLTDILRNEACSLFVNASGEIYAKRWSGCYANTQVDQVVGFIFRRHVEIIGVSQEFINVVDTANDVNVYCFGDSITAGVELSASTSSDKAYHMYFHDWLPTYHFKNYGIGSTGYVIEHTGNIKAGNGVEGIGSTSAEQGDNNVLKVMQGISDSMPVILIFAGTNDFGGNVSESTFRTAVQDTLDYAQTITPHIFVMTPIKRKWSSGDWNETNDVGLYLKDYCDIIIEECETRGITYSVGYDVSLDPLNNVCKTAFVPDGLHPNTAGHIRIARNFFDRLKEAIGI